MAFGITAPQLRTHEDNRISDHSGDVLWALWLVEDNKPKYKVISSDSVETFTIIEGKKSNTRPDSFTEIHQTVYRINTAGCDVGFTWVPAHMDVESNEGSRSRGKKVCSTGGGKQRWIFNLDHLFSTKQGKMGGKCECGEGENVRHVISVQERELFEDLGERRETVFNMCRLLKPGRIE